MEKVVTTTMTDKYVEIFICSGEDDLCFRLPFSLVSPQTALHIASALSQDATISKPSSDPHSVSNEA